MKKIIATAGICLYFCGVMTITFSGRKNLLATIFISIWAILLFMWIRIDRKEKRKIYISAPIEGYNYEERKAFFKEKEEQIKIGGLCVPVNPLKNGVSPYADTEEHLKADLKMLLECDEMHLYGDITKSAGCRIEWQVAKACGIRICDYSFEGDI